MAETDHGARDHATWAASSTARNWACAGALAMAAKITTPEKENPAAAWGTACHQLSEKCLRSGKDAAEFIGTVEATKQHKIDVDEELAATAQEYIDYVRGRIAIYRAETGEWPIVHYEQRFKLDALSPPFDAGGTGDTVMYFPKWKEIEVVDLKGGRGIVVEVLNNKQLRTYGLGAILANPGLDVEKIRVTIVQPRAPHKDGRTRDETFHVADLMEWTADLLKAMKRAKSAVTSLEGGGIPLFLWWPKHLVPGDHCTFCRARGMCPARDAQAMDAAGVWFNDLDQPQIGKGNSPDDMTPAQLAKKLDMVDMLQNYINGVRHYAHEVAESGVEIYDPETDARYQLSETIGHRKWIGDEGATVEALFLKADLAGDAVYNKKLKSPAQIEKVLGAKKKKLIEPLVHRPVTGTNLVRTTKTSRPAVAAAVNKFFSPIED